MKRETNALKGEPGEAKAGVYHHPAEPRIKLTVRASGSRTWSLRAMVKGGAQEYAILPGPSAHDAYLQGHAAIELAQNGISPREHAQAEAERQRNTDAAARAEAVTFGAAVAQFLESPDVASVRAPTANTYRWALTSTHVKPLHGKRLKDITRADIEILSRKFGAHASTWRTVAGSIKRLYSYAMAHEWVTRSPLTGFKLPRVKPRAEPFIVTGERPDWAELLAVLDAIDAWEAANPASQYPDLWRVQMLTGLRPGAVERLEWRDCKLDSEKPTITLREEVSKLKRRLEVPISKACAAVLRRVLERKPELWTKTQRESALVFPGRQGSTLIKPDREASFVDGRVNVTHAKHFRPQRFRDTFISWAEWRLVPYSQIARLIDWKAERMLPHYSAQGGALAEDRAIVERWASEVELTRNPVFKVSPLRRQA